MRTRNLAAVAALALGLMLTGCGGAASTVPESTATPEPVDLSMLLEQAEVATLVVEQVVAEQVEAERLAAEQAEADRIAAEQQVEAEQVEQQQQQAPQPKSEPAPAPAPEPAPAPQPDPIRCPGGSSSTASDGYNDTACMPNVAPNGGSCFEGDNGMLAECQPFKP